VDQLVRRRPVTRVLFTHRYSMAVIRHLCETGGYPRQHLWGADALERAGYGVVYGTFGRGRRVLSGLSYRLGDRLGDLEQQAAMLRRARESDLIYAGEASMLAGLVRLRRRGRGVPLVAVAHRADAAAAGLDVAICLSTRIRDELVGRHGRDLETTPVAAWGPDLAFPGYAAGTDELVVSAGKTDRDTATLRRALDGLGLAARVHDGPARPYAEVLADLRRASIVAIPLARTDRLLGLSEVNDALALGKPIVMTRTPAIDFDPEEVGCGLGVDPFDAGGWRAALEKLSADAALRAEMGRRGRAFAERGHDAAAFGEAVVAAVVAAGAR
jgi:hypothetical protein